MARYAPAALVAALLVATGLAFLHTESLKLETSPIRQTRVTKLFSPVCHCNTSKARIALRLAKPDVVSVSIVDTSGSDVRQLAFERPRSGRVAFLWNGRDDEGQVVPDGSYRARVRLDLIEKTFLLPNLIASRHEEAGRAGRLRTAQGVLAGRGPARRQGRGALHGRRARPRDAVRRRDQARRRREPEAGRRAALVRDGGRTLAPRAQRTRSRSPLPTRPATSRLLSMPGHVRIRYVELASSRLTAKPGGVVRVRVSTRRAAGALAARQAQRGRPRARLPRSASPSAPGRYILSVAAHGHRAGGVVVVAGP